MNLSHKVVQQKIVQLQASLKLRFTGSEHGSRQRLILTAPSKVSAALIERPGGCTCKDCIGEWDFNRETPHRATD